MEYGETPHLSYLKDSMTEYIRLNYSLLKLNVYEKMGKTFSLISYGLVFMCVGILTLFFMFMTLAFVFSWMTGNYICGFGMVSVICAAAWLTVYLKRRKLKRFLLNIFISSLLSLPSQTHEKET